MCVYDANLNLDISLGKQYQNESQKIRVISEAWTERNVFCASCGGALIREENNARVLDFKCAMCKSQFELKSTRGKFSRKVPDGAFKSMMSRLCEISSPDFFFLTYDIKSFCVTNFFAVPTSFIDATVIEKRKPLGSHARRAGWTGCNIMLDKIPEVGKIFYIKNSEIKTKTDIMDKWKKTTFLKNHNDIENRGWTLEILRNIQSLNTKEFTLQEMYDFEKQLKNKYPHNNFIQAKIRQQLQTLRDAGLIIFKGGGRYVTNFNQPIKLS